MIGRNAVGSLTSISFRTTSAQRTVARAARKFHLSASTSAKTTSVPAPGHKEKLVVLGSGWGGYSLLKDLNKSKYEVYLVSPNTYMAFTPLLAQCAVGTLEFRAAMEPVRSTPDVHFHHAWADHIDLENKTLTLSPSYPPSFRESDPLLGVNDQQQGSDQSHAPSQSQSIYPNARGGHSSAMVRAPHRRAIEDSDEDPAEVPQASETQDDFFTSSSSSPVQSKEQQEIQAWKTEEVGREYKLDFDKLVIAVGSYNRTFGTKGVKENAWFLKDVQNARAIRWRLLECLEQASHPTLTDVQRRALLTFIVVGGGPTGTEFSAELHDLVTSDVKRLFPQLAPMISIYLVDAAPGILGNFDAKLAEYASKKFQRDGIRVLNNRKVKAVERGRLVVEPDGEIAFGLLVWSTGVCASPLVKQLSSVLKDEKSSSILTDDELRAYKNPINPSSSSSTSPSTTTDITSTSLPEVWSNVYSIGDCAQMKSKYLPATAQVAAQKAKHLARILNGDMEDAEERIFRHKNMGSMASIGGGKAIIDMPKGALSGRAAFALWRGAYTLMAMSWRNKIMLPFFWTVNAIFGRDLTRF